MPREENEMFHKKWREKLQHLNLKKSFAGLILAGILFVAASCGLSYAAFGARLVQAKAAEQAESARKTKLPPAEEENLIIRGEEDDRSQEETREEREHALGDSARE